MVRNPFERSNKKITQKDITKMVRKIKGESFVVEVFWKRSGLSIYIKISVLMLSKIKLLGLTKNKW